MNELDMEVAVSSIDFGGVSGVSDYKPDWWVDDGDKNTWQDGYTARRRVFPDGQCEVSVCLDKHYLGAAVYPANRAKRGESEKREQNQDVAGRAAKKAVRHRCKALGADRMVTLTYRDNVTDRERALKDWKAFCRRLGKVNGFQYVAVIEHQERGAIHFHVAVKGRQSYALLRSIWQRVVGRDEGGREMGQVNVREPRMFGFGPRGAHKLASYIAKYCGKGFDPVDANKTLNQKRYFSSRGIVVPVVESWRLHGVTNMAQAVQAAVSALTGHAPGSWDSWVNHALGIVYLATEPGWLTDEEICPF